MLRQGAHVAFLKESNDIVALYKPAGVSFHGKGDEKPGFVRIARQHQSEGLIPYTGRLYPVHRLDSCTSGIVLFGKSSRAAGHLVEAFRQKAVSKYYVALSSRPPRKKMGTVSGDMARSRRATWKLLRSTDAPAVTKFWSCGTPELRFHTRLFLLRPLTGRTHQLRVALKSLGSPILGDPLYAFSEEAKLEDRTYLHAVAVRVCLGSEVMQVVCHPSEGCLFNHHAFQSLMHMHFPHDLEFNTGTWFADQPLLRSDLVCLQPETSEPIMHNESSLLEF